MIDISIKNHVVVTVGDIVLDLTNEEAILLRDRLNDMLGASLQHLPMPTVNIPYSRDCNLPAFDPKCGILTVSASVN